MSRYWSARVLCLGLLVCSVFASSSCSAQVAEEGAAVAPGGITATLKYRYTRSVTCSKEVNGKVQSCLSDAVTIKGAVADTPTAAMQNFIKALELAQQPDGALYVCKQNGCSLQYGGGDPEVVPPGAGDGNFTVRINPGRFQIHCWITLLDGTTFYAVGGGRTKKSAQANLQQTIEKFKSEVGYDVQKRGPCYWLRVRH